MIGLSNNQREEDSTTQEGKIMLPHFSHLEINQMTQIEVEDKEIRKETPPKEDHHKEGKIQGTHKVTKTEASWSHLFVRSATKMGITACYTAKNSQNSFQEEAM